jgi:hypothetical protein
MHNEYTTIPGRIMNERNGSVMKPSVTINIAAFEVLTFFRGSQREDVACVFNASLTLLTLRLRVFYYTCHYTFPIRLLR